ncbi:MAG: hypothetical protein K6B67_00205 [Lachnospiraceae bacterium]|nr:hypothetical protein [Lachnospiraceae bacterium]
MNPNTIQQTANQILEAAELDMDRVIELEIEHGKCINFHEYSTKRVWVFNDKYELHIDK